MENFFNTVKTEPAAAGFKNYALKKIRAAWRPKSGPAKDIPGPTAAAAASPGNQPDGEKPGALDFPKTEIGIESIDFSRVPERSLSEMKRLAELRLAGKHPGRIGYGIGPQIDRLQQKSSGAGGLDPELLPLTKGSPTAWRPMTGPLAPG